MICFDLLLYRPFDFLLLGLKNKMSHCSLSNQNWFEVYIWEESNAKLNRKNCEFVIMFVLVIDSLLVIINYYYKSFINYTHIASS